MGGNAFERAAAPGEPKLHTPRMSKETYGRLRSTYQKRLMETFPGSLVETLIEAPEKETYGDMDFVVARDDPVDWDWQQVADSIGARGYISLSRHKCTLAVPADGSKHTSKAVQYIAVPDHDQSSKEAPQPPATVIPQKREAPSSSAEESTSAADLLSVAAEECAHIDIEVVSPELYDWYMFYASYGDLAGLLGHAVRHLGFTITDKGLFLRHKTLDDSKSLTYVNISDSEGMLHLSHDPDRVMQFLGLSAEEYRAGFTTIGKFYSWLGTCRLLSPQAIMWKRNRSTDRRKEKRPIFSNFLNHWLPDNHPEWVNASTSDMTESLGINTAVRESESALKATLEDLGQRGGGGQAASAPMKGATTAIAAPQNKHTLPKPIHLPESVLKHRADLAKEAADFFDKTPEFDAINANLQQKFGNATAGELLKAMLAPISGKSEKGLNEIVKAFRRHVSVDDQCNLGVAEVPHADEESELWKLMDDNGKSFKYQVAVKVFAEEHWSKIRERERKRVTAAKNDRKGVSTQPT